MSERVKAAIMERLLDTNRLRISRAESQKIYDDWADTFDKDMQTLGGRWMFLAAQELNSILGENKDSRILDLAAGTGLVGLELQKFGFTNIDALDVNRKMLQKAGEKGIYKNLICAELGPNRLQIDDDTYDGLLITGAFFPHHVDHTCLQELVRITKPGGVIVLFKHKAEWLKKYSQEFAAKLEPAIRDLQGRGGCTLILQKEIADCFLDYPAQAYIWKVTA